MRAHIFLVCCSSVSCDLLPPDRPLLNVLFLFVHISCMVPSASFVLILTLIFLGILAAWLVICVVWPPCVKRLGTHNGMESRDIKG